MSLTGMLGGMTMYVPEIVTESDDYKLLWNFNIQTDHEIGGEDQIWSEKEDEKVEKH